MQTNALLCRDVVSVVTAQGWQPQGRPKRLRGSYYVLRAGAERAGGAHQQLPPLLLAISQPGEIQRRRLAARSLARDELVAGELPGAVAGAAADAGAPVPGAEDAGAALVALVPRGLDVGTPRVARPGLAAPGPRDAKQTSLVTCARPPMLFLWIYGSVCSPPNARRPFVTDCGLLGSLQLAVRHYRRADLPWAAARNGG